MKINIRNIIIISGACMVTVIGVAAMPAELLKEKSHNSQAQNVRKGIRQLEAMEHRDIYEVESEIQSVKLQREAEKETVSEPVITQVLTGQTPEAEAGSTDTTADASEIVHNTISETEPGMEFTTENGVVSGQNVVMEQEQPADLGQQTESEQLVLQSDSDNTSEYYSDNNTYYTENIDVNSFNYKEIFANSVVMGDSISAALSEYKILDSTSVVAKVGGSLTALDDALDTVTQLSPQNVFLYYGLNDVGHVRDNYGKFKEEYENFVIRLKQALPNTKIYANLLFPVNDASKIGVYYEDLTPYNNIIIEVCQEQGIICLDNRDMVKEEYYEGDGYHFKYSFYPYWLYRMALGAELIQ